MRRSKSKSRTASVGRVCELIFAATAESLGCTAFLPVGGESGVDMILRTPTNRKLACQVKGQSTTAFSSVDLRKADSSIIDVLAVFNGKAGGWFMMTGKQIAKRRTLSARVLRKHKADWDLLK